MEKERERERERNVKDDFWVIVWGIYILGAQGTVLWHLNERIEV